MSQNSTFIKLFLHAGHNVKRWGKWDRKDWPLPSKSSTVEKEGGTCGGGPQAMRAWPWEDTGAGRAKETWTDLTLTMTSA